MSHTMLRSLATFLHPSLRDWRLHLCMALLCLPGTICMEASRYKLKQQAREGTHLLLSPIIIGDDVVVEQALRPTACRANGSRGLAVSSFLVNSILCSLSQSLFQSEHPRSMLVTKHWCT